MTHSTGTRIRDLRCWLARKVIGPHGSIVRNMSDQEWRDYINEQMRAEVEGLACDD